MKKKTAPKRTAVAKAKPDGLAPLVAEVRNLIQSARRGVASVVDTFQVLTCFEIGRRIVEHEQRGTRRAAYGVELLPVLSARLGQEFGRGFSVKNLENMRRFYLLWKDRALGIPQRPSAKLAPPVRPPEKSQTLSAELVVSAIGQKAADQFQIAQKPSGQLVAGEIFQTPSEKLARPSSKGRRAPDQAAISEQPIRKSPFTLSWSHYVELLSVKDPAERSFYEIESANEGWSLSELRRQKATCLYERLALSRDKAGIKRLAKEGQLITKPEDLFKEPLVLNFLGLEERASYSESDLESAILSHLEEFLLELGKGFLFEARQKRFTFDGDHYYLDLVFYNRLLRCYVVIDLKLDKLTHQDLGQMQMYVNHYDRHEKLPDENPTVGLLLCKEKKDAVVKLTLPKDANIHAKEYQLYLPSKQLLKAKLLEWSRPEKTAR